MSYAIDPAQQELVERQTRYKAALKEVNSTKPKPSYVRVEAGRYDNQFILTMDKAIELMKAMEGALKYNAGYSSDPPELTSFSKWEFHVISAEEVERIKIAALLNVPVRDLPEKLT